MFVMRMRIRLNFIIGIWTNDKKHNRMKKYLLHSVHMQGNHTVLCESFCAKTKINPTIMRRRCLSIGIYSVREHFMGSYRDA